MATQLKDIIARAQEEANATTDPRVNPDTWLRWACDGITEVLSNIDFARRVQDDRSVLDQVFAAGDDGDEATIPATLEDVVLPLQYYVQYRYHASQPKSDEERAAAGEAYAAFLRGFGIQPQNAAK